MQLEKLAKKNEAKAESLIEQIEHMPEGEKFSKKIVDDALAKETPRAKKKSETVLPDESTPLPNQVGSVAQIATADDIPPWEDMGEQKPAVAPIPESISSKSKVNANKVKLVAELLGLSDESEEVIMARLIDEFLALKQA